MKSLFMILFLAGCSSTQVQVKSLQDENARLTRRVEMLEADALNCTRTSSVQPPVVQPPIQIAPVVQTEEPATIELDPPISEEHKSIDDEL
jgi:hypothetical protein